MFFFNGINLGIYIYIRIYHIYICNGTSWYIMEYHGIHNGINDGYMPRLRALRVEPMAFPVAFDGEAWHGGMVTLGAGGRTDRKWVKKKKQLVYGNPLNIWDQIWAVYGL
jgi:hypothetical protein